MPSEEDIENQQRLLAASRQTLSILLHQKILAGGTIHTPVGVLNGIKEARSDIRRIKSILRSWKADVDDHPDDEEHANPHLTLAIQSGKQPIQILIRGDFLTVSVEERAAAINAFAEKLGISSDQIGIYRVFESSIGFDLSIPKDAIPRLRALLEADDPQFHSLGLEQVTIFGDEDVNEMWRAVDGHFVRSIVPISSSYQQGARPPALAEYLIQFFAPRNIREPLLGDLEEEYRTIYAQKGRRKADTWYKYQALVSLYPLLFSRVSRLWRSIRKHV